MDTLDIILIIITIFSLGGLVASYASKSTTPPMIINNNYSDHDKAMNFLSSRKQNDTFIALPDGDSHTKTFWVMNNMPSIKKIEVQYKVGNTWFKEILDYSKIEKGLVDLNDLNEITIGSNEPFLK